MKTETEIVSTPKARGTDRPPQNLEKMIARHPFLKGLSPHQTRILSDCAMYAKFEPGELIFREGDPANRFHLILKGKVILESQAGSGRGRIPVQTVESGEILGWSWLFPPYYWHFDARTVEPTETIYFLGAPLREECENDHDLGYELVKRMAGVMMKRLQATRRHLLGLGP